MGLGGEGSGGGGVDEDEVGDEFGLVGADGDHW